MRFMAILAYKWLLKKTLISIESNMCVYIVSLAGQLPPLLPTPDFLLFVNAVNFTIDLNQTD